MAGGGRGGGGGGNVMVPCYFRWRNVCGQGRQSILTLNAADSLFLFLNGMPYTANRSGNVVN